MFGRLGRLNTFSTDIFDLQWVHQNVSPSLRSTMYFYMLTYIFSCMYEIFHPQKKET